MSFYTLSLGGAKGLVFCFDLYSDEDDVRPEFLKACKKGTTRVAARPTTQQGTTTTSLCLAEILCPAVADQFDLDVWTFRKPIRTFESVGGPPFFT